MRKRILKCWLYHYGFRFTEDVANLLIDDASREDAAAQLFIKQAEARHATTLLRDRYLRPLLDLKTAKEARIFRASFESRAAAAQSTKVGSGCEKMAWDLRRPAQPTPGR